MSVLILGVNLQLNSDTARGMPLFFRAIINKVKINAKSSPAPVACDWLVLRVKHCYMPYSRKTMKRSYDEIRVSTYPRHGREQLSRSPLRQKRSTPKVVGHIKMKIIDDLKASTETPRIKRATDCKANATTDVSSTYTSRERGGVVASRKVVVMDDKKKEGKVLP